MPLDNVAVKTRPLIDSEYAVNTANNAADGATDDSTNRARGPLTFSGSTFNASGHALSGRDRRNKEHRRKQRAHNKLFHHISAHV